MNVLKHNSLNPDELVEFKTKLNEIVDRDLFMDVVCQQHCTIKIKIVQDLFKSNDEENKIN